MKKVITLSVLALLLFFAPTASAQEIFSVTHNDIPIEGPIFDFDDFKPGDCATESVVVENLSENSITVAVKANEVIKVGTISDALSIKITNSSNLVIYEDTLEKFFSNSETEDGIFLGILGVGESETFTFQVCFPKESGNEYQEDSVEFDLIFGQILHDHIVINEVYYDVDESHGKDCTIDNEIEASIIGNGSGSKNIIDINIGNSCILVQNNVSRVVNNVSTSSNTGNNSIFGNLGGIFSITTGNSNVSINIFNTLGFNFGSCSCVKCGRNDEWVELYNPTNETVNLRNWKLEDNSGQMSRLKRVLIGPGEFVLISKSKSTWRFWDEPTGSKKMALGQEIGDGLQNAGDHLILCFKYAVVVDTVGWGNDTIIWTTGQPSVNQGISIERKSPGFDTNSASDWEERFLPTPGF